MTENLILQRLFVFQFCDLFYYVYFKLSSYHRGAFFILSYLTLSMFVCGSVSVSLSVHLCVLCMFFLLKSQSPGWEAKIQEECIYEKKKLLLIGLGSEMLFDSGNWIRLFLNVGSGSRSIISTTPWF